MIKDLIPSKKLIYLDSAAATPLDERVKFAMEKIEDFANPSSLHKPGLDSKKLINHSRSIIAEVIGSKSEEIIFTAGGTESINLAIFGVARDYEIKHQQKGHIISSTIEHHAVLESLNALKEEGWEATLIQVDRFGKVNIDEVLKKITNDTCLITIMYANNEIGTIQPIKNLSKKLKSINKLREANNLPRIVLHTDACQAAGALDINVNALWVDLMSINGSKIYGPKQSGFLYIKKGIPIRPLIFGGGQETNLRSGTENVTGIVGLAEALKLAAEEKENYNSKIKVLHKYFIEEIKNEFKDFILNGPEFENNSDSKEMTRLPNIINISFKNIDGEALLIYLDSYNISGSTGSACTSNSSDTSHVLRAINIPREYINGTLRFSLNKFTTKEDLSYTLKVLHGLESQLRAIKLSK